MSTLKPFLAVVLLTSIGANVYYFNKKPEVPEPIVVHSVITDEAVVMRTPGGLLEVSTIKAAEQFDTTKDHQILGFSIANTATQIRVPATYRYHIELAPTWKILLRDKVFIVVAPPVKPSLPVAIDTARMEKKSLGAWSYFTSNNQLEQLQKSISQTLAIKAVSPIYVQLQREPARKTVTEFVAKWLITQEQWKGASAYPILVVFSDEPIQVLGNVPIPFVNSAKP